MFETLNLAEAAEFLKMNPEVLRRKAKAGKVPGRKTGKSWLFIKQHLAEWVSGLLLVSAPVVDNSIDQLNEINKCQFISVKKSGGYNIQTQMDKEYSALLGLQTEKKLKNSMIN